MTRTGDLIVVTPEHVEVVLTPAGLGSRFLALTIDAVITLGVPLLIQRLIGIAVSAGVAFAVMMTTQFFFGLGYHVYFETRRQGRTIGKRALGLRVVDSRGLPITAAQSLIRNSVRALDALPFFYGLGAFVVLADRRGRRLGDFAAETLVIEEPTSAEYGTLKLSERQFNTLRTARVLRLIRHRVSLEERELLLELCLRAERLKPADRYELMEEVGNYYRRLLDVDDPRLSCENLIRDLTGILFSPAATSRLSS